MKGDHGGWGEDLLISPKREKKKKNPTCFVSGAGQQQSGKCDLQTHYWLINCLWLLSADMELYLQQKPYCLTNSRTQGSALSIASQYF